LTALSLSSAIVRPMFLDRKTPEGCPIANVHVVDISKL
jgi:hypothetical protein